MLLQVSDTVVLLVQFAIFSVDIYCPSAICQDGSNGFTKLTLFTMRLRT